MAGPIYLVDSLLDHADIVRAHVPSPLVAAFASADESSSDFPIERLSSGRQSEVWRAPTSGDFWSFDIDLGAAKKVTLAALHNHRSIASYKVLSSDTGDLEDWTERHDDKDPRDHDVYGTFDATARYWRVLVEASTGEHATVGELRLGESVQLPRSFRWGFVRSRGDIVVSQETLAGNRWTRHINRRGVTLQLGWTLLEGTALDALQAMHEAAKGSAMPVTLAPWPDAPARSSEVMMGAFASDDLSMTEAGVNDKHASLGFREQPRDIEVSS